MLICSHGDVIKAILADALGMHLDAFQRIVVAPASISVIRYTPLRPFVERINDTGDLGSISPYPAPSAPTDQAASSSDAVPGGVSRADRPLSSKVPCPRQIHVFRSPDRFLAGTVGQPGEREFFLQVVDGRRVLSVACEKQQVAVLADRLGSLITEVARRFGAAGRRHRPRSRPAT